MNYHLENKMEGSLMNVKDIMPIKLEEAEDIYTVLSENWDSGRLEQYKEAKVLFLDDANSAFAIGSVDATKQLVPIGQKGKLKFDIEPILQEAKSIGASSVIIAESCLPDNIYYQDGDRAKLLDQFNETAKSYNVTIDDYISISSLEASSLKLQSYF